MTRSRSLNTDVPVVASVQRRSDPLYDDAVFGYQITGGLNITTQTVTISMTEDGRITRYDAEFTGYPAAYPGTTAEGTYVLRFTVDGETAVERPNWVEDTRNAST